MHILPPKPKIYTTAHTSRWISTVWTFNERIYLKYFEVYLNDTLINTIDKSIYLYNYTKLLPNRYYKLNVKLISNSNNISDPIFVKTLEEAPEIPSNDDIKNKIVPLTKDIQSNFEHYAIQIDLSLFSNQYGFVHSYRIYVRQDVKKNSTKFDSIGTYNDAMINQSIDYLALIIPIKNFIKSNQIIRIIIGNETLCQYTNNKSIPCNGKLKQNQNYKILVSGCANVGCTSVLSQIFTTQQKPIEESGSKGWIAIFPILVLLILIGLGIWKQKQVKLFYENYIKRLTKNDESTIHFKSDGSISLTPIRREIRPKYLIEYINMTHQDENIIYAEYKELESMSPRYHQSNNDRNYAPYNRYTNISARGPWNRTAVRLTGSHRFYDYINANEINSYDNKKQYIACQAPIKETTQDFWDMIIQYKVSTIIMLTKIEETNPTNPSQTISKCYPYFPMSIDQCLTFDRIIIKLIHIEYYHNSDLEIRHINVKDGGGVEQRLIHYYFTGWPDYNVVQPNKLVDLIQTINKHRQHQRTTRVSSSPTVVHCSAGVGRTGTYISVDTIIRLLDRPDEELTTIKLDVMGIVHQLRKDRGKMVQTKEQYMLVNRCVEQYLRQTDRIDIFLQGSNVYENILNSSSKASPHIYVNLRKPTNVTPYRASMIDPPSHYTNLTPPTSLTSRSSTPEHIAEEYRQRFYTDIKRSIHHYYPNTVDHHSNGYIFPPIPPRQSRSRHSSTRSQQSDV